MRRLITIVLMDKTRAAGKWIGCPIFQATCNSFLAVIFFICSGLSVSVPALGKDVSPTLDPERGVVLPSVLAKGVFKQHRKNVVLRVEEWEITPAILSSVDAALSLALKKDRIGQGLPSLPNYYRQYLPGRLRQSRVIFVNGFDQTDSDMFPDRGIPADRWRHQLMIAYGGGCGFWYGVYLVDEDRFLELGPKGDRLIICNGPK